MYEGNIEMEVMRRVAEAKLIMEKNLQEEYDRKYEVAVSELQMKEVIPYNVHVNY